MYQLVACDLDETLIGENQQILTENIAAIQQANKQGVKFVPASGRGYMMMQDVLAEIGLQGGENEYTIAYNGACIVENSSGKELFFHGLTYEQTEWLWEIGRRFNVGLHVYTKNNWYIAQITEFEKEKLYGNVFYQEIAVTDLALIKNEPIAKVIFHHEDMDYLNQIAQEILPEIKDEIELSFSSNRYIELNRKGVNKGNALLELAKILDIKQSETIAIGDNLNDHTMIAKAGLGVAVANAVPEIKAIADYICDRDHNTGGVAETIHKFVLHHK